MRYLAKYPPDAKGRCRCETCWCEESYALSKEPNPEDDGKPFGAYVERAEEAIVIEPRLWVDDEKVTIIGRRIRMWDNKPVPHDAWLAMSINPKYSNHVVEGLLPTGKMVGWRKVWKQAYQPEDERLWPELGIQFQYRYQGTWHEEDQIH